MNEQLTSLFRRHVLDHFGAPGDVNLETVSIYFVHQEAFSYSEYDGEKQSFQMNAEWLQATPDPIYAPTPDEGGGFRVSRVLEGEELATFLDTIG